MNRRTFAQFMFAAPLVYRAGLPSSALAQSKEKPDFDVAGTATTDPVGYDIAWNSDWELKDDLGPLLEKSVPGTRGFIALDIDSIPEIAGSHNHRVILESVADPSVSDPETYMSAIPDDFLEQQGYAPGTYIHSRHVTEQGGWICHAAAADPAKAFRGIQLFYLPQSPGDPVLIVSGIDVAPTEEEYSPAYLEFIDSTISINDDWLLGMDDLENYWQALEDASNGPLS